MGNEIVISVTKDKILINGMECTDDNFEQVFNEAKIGLIEYCQIINMILAKVHRRGGVFERE